MDAKESSWRIPVPFYGKWWHSLLLKDDFKFTRWGLSWMEGLGLGEGNEEKASLMGSYFGNVLSILFGGQRRTFPRLIDWVKAHRPEPALAKIYSNGSEEGLTFVVS
ncbi:hypothetical protein V6N11_055117, partial [Hibiscus sabdariffa]